MNEYDITCDFCYKKYGLGGDRAENFATLSFHERLLSIKVSIILLILRRLMRRYSLDRSVLVC